MLVINGKSIIIFLFFFLVSLPVSVFGEGDGDMHFSIQKETVSYAVFDRSEFIAARKPLSKKKQALKAGEGLSNEPVNLEPSSGKGISMAALLALDLLIPGGGHFYRKSYFFGAGFLLLKAAGIYSIYHFSKSFVDYKKAYSSAKRTRWFVDPLGLLLYKDPDGNFKSLSEIKKGHDLAVQLIVLTAFANLVVYTVSAIINYIFAKELNMEALPTFEFYSFEGFGQKSKFFNMKYSFRF